jgi:hypothetical protein
MVQNKKWSADLPLPPLPHVKQQPSRETAAQCCGGAVIITGFVFWGGEEGLYLQRGSNRTNFSLVKTMDL